MNLRENKVLDFSEKINEGSIEVILGHNGSGKTRYLKSCSIRETKEKNIISESYPILLKLIIQILNDDEFLDGKQYLEVTEKKLPHLNTLLGKEYKSIKYTLFNYEDIFDVYGEDVNHLFGKHLLSNFDDIKSHDFYHVQVSTDTETFSTVELGVGELAIIVYFLLFENTKNTTFFLDEPGNYLSSLSISNFIKLIIKSSAINGNEFFLTTNNQEIIDYLISYKVVPNIKYVDCKHGMVSWTMEEYYSFYEERYSLIKKINSDVNKIVFVEDNLAQKFVEKIVPDIKVVLADGAGNLKNIEKVFNFLKDSSLYDGDFSIVYDRDEYDKSKTYANNILFLPFENVEQAVIDMVKEQRGLFETIGKSTLMKLQMFCDNKELHDAYKAILIESKMSEDDVINYLIKLHQSEVNDMKKALM